MGISGMGRFLLESSSSFSSSHQQRQKSIASIYNEFHTPNMKSKRRIYTADRERDGKRNITMCSSASWLLLLFFPHFHLKCVTWSVEVQIEEKDGEMESKKYGSVAADDAENADAAVCAVEKLFFCLRRRRRHVWRRESCVTNAK